MGVGGKRTASAVGGGAHSAGRLADARQQRLLGPDQAAAHLEIRRVDWDYAVAAGWVTPVTHVWSRVGRRRQVEVPLYRQGDVDDLLQVPGVEWESVRAAAPGTPSPLRAFANLPERRATALGRFLAAAGEQQGVEMWAWYDSGLDCWQVDWQRRDDGGPARAEVEQLLLEDPSVAVFEATVDLACRAGAAIRVDPPSRQRTRE
jgi:hypothetical protein